MSGQIRLSYRLRHCEENPFASSPNHIKGKKYITKYTRRGLQHYLVLSDVYITNSIIKKIYLISIAAIAFWLHHLEKMCTSFRKSTN